MGNIGFAERAGERLFERLAVFLIEFGQVQKQIIADVAGGDGHTVYILFDLIDAKILVAHRPRAFDFLDGGAVVRNRVLGYKLQPVLRDPAVAIGCFHLPTRVLTRWLLNDRQQGSRGHQLFCAAAGFLLVQRALRLGGELGERLDFVAPDGGYALAVLNLRCRAHGNGHD